MTREQADKEALKIFRETNIEEERIMENAKKDGTWLPGIDGNEYLFRELRKKALEKLQKLSSEIDE